MYLAFAEFFKVQRILRELLAQHSYFTNQLGSRLHCLKLELYLHLFSIWNSHMCQNVFEKQKHWRNNPGKSVTWLRLKISGPFCRSCPATPKPLISICHSPTHIHLNTGILLFFFFSRLNITFKSWAFNTGIICQSHRSRSYICLKYVQHEKTNKMLYKKL